jgi:hypothetical protein
MKHPSILFVTLLEVNTKSDEFFLKFWNVVPINTFLSPFSKNKSHLGRNFKTPKHSRQKGNPECVVTIETYV